MRILIFVRLRMVRHENTIGIISETTSVPSLNGQKLKFVRYRTNLESLADFDTLTLQSVRDDPNGFVPKWWGGGVFNRIDCFFDSNKRREKDENPCLSRKKELIRRWFRSSVVRMVSLLGGCYG